MLRLLREKAHIVGWAIVISFCLTMFAGTVLFGGFGGSGGGSGEGQAPKQRSFAYLGDIPLNLDLYQGVYSSIIQRVPIDQLTPDLVELIHYQSMMLTIQKQVFLLGAEEKELKPSKEEINLSLDTVYRTYDIKNKKALKALLKEKDVSYKEYMATVKDDIRVQKFEAFLKDSIVINDADVEAQYQEVDVAHILFKVEPGKPADSQKVLAHETYEKIQAGASFEDLAKTLSDDLSNKEKSGRLGWIKLGNTVRPFEEAAFRLKPGTVSRPIRSEFGFHLLKSYAKRDLEKPKDSTFEKRIESYLEYRKPRVGQEYLSNFMMENPLVITEPVLKAYYAKTQGNIPEAVGAYQLQISKAPQNPVPHYLLARLYIMTGSPDDAKAEMKKALVKTELNPQTNFPQLNMLMGDILINEKKRQEALPYFETALALSNNNLKVVQEIELIAQPIKNKAFNAKVAAEVKRIEAENKAQAEAAQKASVLPAVDADESASDS